MILKICKDLLQSMLQFLYTCTVQSVQGKSEGLSRLPQRSRASLPKLLDQQFHNSDD